MRAQSVLVLFAGAATLIVVSVVLTVYLVNRPRPELAVPAHPPAVIPTPSIDLNAPSPVIVAPPLTPPLSSPAPAVAPSSAPSTAAATTTADASNHSAPSTPSVTDKLVPVAPGIAAPAPVTAASAPVTSAPSQSATTASAAAKLPRESATAPSATPAVVGPDLKISGFVDAIRVTGIRSSGEDSKVLMNDRVYRVNDIVDRSLGLKLIKVAPDSLTFADPSGVIYVKNF